MKSNQAETKNIISYGYDGKHENQNQPPIFIDDYNFLKIVIVKETTNESNSICGGENKIN